MYKNYYQILGLENNASINQIKKAYRTYATKFHPDKQNGDKFFEERFKEIKEAYDVLSDDIKRKNYDTKWQNNFSESSSYSDQTHQQNAENEFKRKYEQYRQEENNRNEKIKRENEEKQKAETQANREKKSKIFYTSKNLTINGIYINLKGESFLLENYDSSTIRKDDNSDFVFIGVVLIIIGILTIAFFIGVFLIIWGISGLFYKEYYVVLTNEYGDTPLIKGRKRKMKRISNRINKAMKLV